MFPHRFTKTSLEPPRHSGLESLSFRFMAPFGVPNQFRKACHAHNCMFMALNGRQTCQAVALSPGCRRGTLHMIPFLCGHEASNALSLLQQLSPNSSTAAQSFSEHGANAMLTDIVSVY